MQPRSAEPASRCVALLAVLLAFACQGPPEPRASVDAASGPFVPLERTLTPLEQAFDDRADVPRLVALLPSRCEDCADALHSLRAGVLEAFPGRALHVFVVVPGTGTCDACGQPSAIVADPRVTVFSDPEGRAGRAFARGLLPVDEARELFLFYPRGTRWHDEPAPTRYAPASDEWWHALGRIAPERYCTHLELDLTLRSTMARLLGEPASLTARR